LKNYVQEMVELMKSLAKEAMENKGPLLDFVQIVDIIKLFSPTPEIWNGDVHSDLYAASTYNVSISKIAWIQEFSEWLFKSKPNELNGRNYSPDVRRVLTFTNPASPDETYMQLGVTYLAWTSTRVGIHSILISLEDILRSLDILRLELVIQEFRKSQDEFHMATGGIFEGDSLLATYTMAWIQEAQTNRASIDMTMIPNA